MNVRPLNDRVLVTRLESEAVSPGGIIIPEKARTKSTRAKVVAVGPGRRLDNGKRVEPLVKPGDIVTLGKYSGNEVEVNGEKCLFVIGEEILAVEVGS